MAEIKINRKFLANPGFGIQNVGGQTLTMTIDGKIADGVQVYKKVYFGSLFMQMGAAGALQKDGLVDITPGVQTLENLGGTAAEQRVWIFKDFVSCNPVHIIRMNIRAVSMDALPQNITIYTPNVFTGQFDKQIVNVTADANMYQNQASIITVNVDAYISRNCIVEFGGQFAVQASQTVASKLYVDVTFDKYLSLEKALYENLQLLATPAGQVSAAADAVNEVNTQVATAVGTAFRMPNNERTADVMRDAIRAGGTPTNVALQQWTR